MASPVDSPSTRHCFHRISPSDIRDSWSGRMDGDILEDIARQLSAVEVALFLCLASRAHCLIETTRNYVDDLAKELTLISSNTFDLSSCIVDCCAATSIEDIHDEILTQDARNFQSRPPYVRGNTESSSNISVYMGPRDRSRSPVPNTPADDVNVVNIVIAKNFNLVEDDVQVQALQLMRTRNLATEAGILHAPADFLFVPLVVRDGDLLDPPLRTHLSEHLLVSHFHDPEDGYVYLEENEWFSDGQYSTSSVIHKSKAKKQQRAKIDEMILNKLREASESVTTSAEVVRYIQDIVVFLRLSRAVAGGISAKSNNQFAQFAQLLAPIHGIDYLTPSIVALAARKVFRHRIVVAKPEDDRSLQYGSDLGAVSQVLDNVTPDSILDGVLALEPPI
ncbi:hypothetical protein N7532_005700 [Penicillium argentinense]|uniref:magnesium chelatase n=1 Tax=Penicillium argentinense TaxID=1131581 RepID=A0A9W9KA26_9EURO|nr:uncharacterized protein N7532_005700 [Penicillium argentinense]KAJ5098699.1 hypothetical protein N7532_005700 [Penicillium argentinense]